MQWLINNREWVFSGIGVFILTLIISFLFKKKSAISQIQQSGDNSTNYQAAQDINIGVKK